MERFTPTLHVWHDYVCPFSYVAATRIQRIKDAGSLNLKARFHPWPLETANGTQPAAGDEDTWVQLLRTIEPEAFAGWNALSPFWPASSHLLFAAYEAALAQDIEAAERFDLLVRRAIFQHPQPTDSIEALSEPATAAGLDATAFVAMLAEGSAQRRVQPAGADAASQGIRGIPTLVPPNGSPILNPGMKIQRTAEGRVIRDDVETLRVLLQAAAGVKSAGTTGG